MYIRPNNGATFCKRLHKKTAWKGTAYDIFCLTLHRKRKLKTHKQTKKWKERGDGLARKTR